MLIMKRKSGFFLLFALLAFFTSVTASAKNKSYNIYVTIPDTPQTNGNFPVNHWKIRSTPVTYAGKFTADDTVAGPISNLHLVIGGVDIARYFSFINSYFDPASLELTLVASISISEASNSPNALVLFGNFSLPPATKSPTSNYVAAIEPNNQGGTLDTYYGVTQNWAGTIIITTRAVPDS